MRRSFAALTATLALSQPLAAQDTTRVPEGVRVGIAYTPGVRPAIVVLPARDRDSARAIVLKDLDYSDRFEIIPLGPDSGTSSRRLPSAAFNQTTATPGINYNLFRTIGADYAVELLAQGPSTTVRLHELAAGQVRQELKLSLPAEGAQEFRLAVHRVSDEIVRWVTGTPGAAASQLLFVANRKLYRLDSDGAALSSISPEGDEVLSPAWSPDGRRVAYTRFAAGAGSIIVLNLATGQRSVVSSTAKDLNITPTFAPDGRTLAYARSNEDGTDIYTADVIDGCCVQRLTVGRFADNLSPTYAPDGRRLAFVSTRAGLPQVYAMAADGTDQELLAPFDYGVTGSSNAPEWSPDGASVVFHREVSRTPQIFILDIASRRVRQLTSTGRNEDPTWAPDGRHIAFVSDRSGRRQLWVIDIETGRIRQLTFVGSVRLPAWSRRLAGTTITSNQ